MIGRFAVATLVASLSGLSAASANVAPYVADTATLTAAPDTSFATTHDGSLWAISTTGRSLQQTVLIHHSWQHLPSINLGFSPTALAPGTNESLWVASALGVEQFVDHGAKWSPQPFMSVDNHPIALAATAGGSLWIAGANNSLELMNDVAGRWTISPNVVHVAHRPTSLVSTSDTSLWVASLQSPLLQRINVSKSGDATMRSLHVGANIASLTVATDGTLWLALANRPQVQEVSWSGDLVNVHSPVDVGLQGSFTSLGVVASAQDRVWALAQGSNGLSLSLLQGMGGQWTRTSVFAVNVALNNQWVTPHVLALAATDDGGVWVSDAVTSSVREYVSSTATSPVELAPPRLRDVTRRSAPHQGDTFTTTTGSWHNASTYTYQWYRCQSVNRIAPVAYRISIISPTRSGASCSLISGATLASYHSGHGDGGRALVAVVTAHSGHTQNLAEPSTWSAVMQSPPIQNVLLPSITDASGVNFRTGDVMKLSPGSWLNTTKLSFQWYLCTNGFCNTAIVGATGTTYQLAPTDAGHQFQVRVTASSPVTSSVVEWTTVSPTIV